MVDVHREGYLRKKRIRRLILGLLLGVTLAAVAWAVSRLEPAIPALAKEAVWIGEVERGPLVIEVRGTGTLVPEEIRWVASSVEGRVESIPVLPGSAVGSETILMTLSSPELERDASDAELELLQAEAELDQLRVELQAERLSQQVQLASIKADYEQSRLQLGLDEALSEEGLISDLDLNFSRVTLEQLKQRYELEQRRIEFNREAERSRIAAKEAAMQRLRGRVELGRRKVELLRVQAGIAGVLQETPVEVGQQVRPGEILGKVAVPGRLKAELRIPEVQAQSLRIGLPAAIDTRSGVADGRVVRIDPAARQGTVTVDVAFLGKLPKGVRPDQNVDGKIEIDRLDDTLYIGKPAFGQAGSTVGMFKLAREGAEVVRVPVRLGRSSESKMEVLEGLQEGDRVILSDTSEWNDFDRLRLE